LEQNFDNVLKELDVQLTGINEETREKLLQEHGLNKVTEKKYQFFLNL
jgi:hypothetical protein